MDAVPEDPDACGLVFRFTRCRPRRRNLAGQDGRCEARGRPAGIDRFELPLFAVGGGPNVVSSGSIVPK